MPETLIIIKPRDTYDSGIDDHSWINQEISDIKFEFVPLDR